MEGLCEQPLAHVPGKVLSKSGVDSCPTDQDISNAKAELRQNISNILADNGSHICGGSGAGWRRVGHLDMTDPSQSCPDGLTFATYLGVRVCARGTNTLGCKSTFYNTGGSQYTKVCGRVRGYQFGETSAFYGSAHRGGTQTVTMWME